MSYHVISCSIMKYHVMSYHIISCHVMSCHVISCYNVISCNIHFLTEFWKPQRGLTPVTQMHWQPYAEFPRELKSIISKVKNAAQRQVVLGWQSMNDSNLFKIFLTLSKSLLKYHGDCRIWSTPIQGLFSNIRLRLPLVLLLSFDEQPKGRLLLVKLVWFHGTSPKKQDMVSSWWPRAGHWNWPPNHPKHSAAPSEKHHFFSAHVPCPKVLLVVVSKLHGANLWDPPVFWSRYRL